MTELKNDILTTLAYFDIFKYPLSQKEIYLFLGKTYKQDEFEEALSVLVINKSIYKFRDFYCLQNNNSLLDKRIKGNECARVLLKTAEKVAALLAHFPYVRGIAVSGSLSKNFADETSDIDFFIITVKNRVWITRTLMHCLKKISFLFKKEHLFCMNYYIDENELEITEKNIYTATEISTLMPMQGAIAFEQFYLANSWIRAFLPNHFMRIMSAPEIRMSWLKIFVEFILNNSLGDLIDYFLMKITGIRWRKKTNQKKLAPNGFVMSLDTGKHHAKPDPSNLQATILKLYESKAWQVLQRHESKTSRTF